MSTLIRSYTMVGVDAVPVTVEVDLLRRLPQVVIVGAPAPTVREMADRVRSAITSAGFEFPRARVVVNLSPSDLHKSPASALDLAIAVGILVESGQIKAPKGNVAYYGSLSLPEEVRPERGILAVAQAAQADGFTLVAEEASAYLAAAIPGVKARGIRTLQDVTDTSIPILTNKDSFHGAASHLDLKDVPGNLQAISGVLTAVREKRPLLLIGPPGSNKTMIAARIAGLLGLLTPGEALKVATIHEAAGLLPSAGGSTSIQRPFRAPHHTISAAGLVGTAAGGARMGEVSLAHEGVLFLDEFPEFPRATLEVLRGPAEDGQVTLHRAAGRVTLPSRFFLVAAANPCPCGYYGHPKRPCTCTDAARDRYLERLNTAGLLANAIHVKLNPVTNQTSEHWPTTAVLRQDLTKRQAGGARKQAGTTGKQTSRSTSTKPSLAALLAGKAPAATKQAKAPTKARTPKRPRGGVIHQCGSCGEECWGADEYGAERAFDEHIRKCPAHVNPNKGEPFEEYRKRAEAHAAAWRKQNNVKLPPLPKK